MTGRRRRIAPGLDELRVACSGTDHGAAAVPVDLAVPLRAAQAAAEELLARLADLDRAARGGTR